MLLPCGPNRSKLCRLAPRLPAIAAAGAELISPDNGLRRPG